MKMPDYYKPDNANLVLANVGLTLLWFVASFVEIIIIVLYYVVIYPVKKIGLGNIFKFIGWVLYYVFIYPVWLILKWIFNRITKVADTAMNQLISVFIKWILPIIIILCLIMYRHEIYMLIK